ncbi:MAG: hypothetical protein AB8E15_12880 [Bdellovibrionales bacterium]
MKSISILFLFSVLLGACEPFGDATTVDGEKHKIISISKTTNDKPSPTATKDFLSSVRFEENNRFDLVLSAMEQLTGMQFTKNVRYSFRESYSQRTEDKYTASLNNLREGIKIYLEIWFIENELKANQLRIIIQELEQNKMLIFTTEDLY